MHESMQNSLRVTDLGNIGNGLILLKIKIFEKLAWCVLYISATKEKNHESPDLLGK